MALFSQAPQQNKKSEILSRSQVLIAMAVTAIIFLGISKGWVYLTGIPMVPLYWQTEHGVIGFGIGLGVALLSSLIYEIWESYRLAAQEYLEMVLRPLELIDLIWLGLLPGLSEEMLFRGVALPALGMNGIALIITSVVFGVLHMASAKHMSYTVWAIAVGMMLGAVTMYTGNLLSAIMAHVLTNALSGLIWKYKQSKNV
ncbi:MAG: lysostaphin resistance A-like protein [Pseudanabaena sp.]|jgi:membrane protease YdiL (CAAX protease family)|uniref:CPBP family intramembrane glutamic endopeptidase n=1 Tax=Pseudanabaena mucicola TaxID=71190 RepID=UPI002578DD26|nr:CPBP family intramembrane glutamic endopeptidase [Pseudanabaena mucicola]MCA6572206.1 CPBP family intramembrane metalloprotease [Pseudanabaena sp. M53BS1SP1A06MG]MCA6583175.1 CPBP family intramembrane metalloprotease [Pseudanabaena sp. M34BS1SP1A06MG]MCA6589432.1 CPBP family intramembrane metalloprotease [Pseudanabaena sp. M109S1SP1A06QC]MCA6594300.1 CPBP family intramembrane metalloprotease [Pseudanabaena sp. M38BS1SP1A06MG]MCA6598232.1 CPBP family intramembrane metalloprotease [Pseudanaba